MTKASSSLGLRSGRGDPLLLLVACCRLLLCLRGSVERKSVNSNVKGSGEGKMAASAKDGVEIA
jgi:hypothetical protein